MMPDLATCEWNPGSNRSIVSIEIAAKRVPSADRSSLIAAFNARNYSDHVTITKDSITGTAQYESVIKNMNFGSGRLCKVVSRKKWKDADAVSAIVFHIKGRAYGYASVCGNLFELNLVGGKTSVPETTYSTEQTYAITPIIGEPFGPITLSESPIPQNQTPSFQSDCACESSSIGYGGGYFYGGGGGVIIGTPNIPTPGEVTPAIPELPVWSYLGIGAALLMALRRRKQNV